VYRALGPDGNLWFTEGLVLPIGSTLHSSIGRITTAGVVTEFVAPGYPVGITSGPDGNLWFTDPSDDQIGRFILP
jgi:virginiamycin B lyase